MTGFEPGVQLTADTIAAMERLSTSPSKPAMTKQHKATPEQWDDAGAFASDTRACLLELRARVELLEATQQRPPHQDKLDRLIAIDGDDGEPIVFPSYLPDSLLVRVTWLIAKRFSESRPGTDFLPFGREVILEVAAWLRLEYPRREGYGTAWANLIEQEANQ